MSNTRSPFIVTNVGVVPTWNTVMLFFTRYSNRYSSLVYLYPYFPRRRPHGAYWHRSQWWEVSWPGFTRHLLIYPLCSQGSCCSNISRCCLVDIHTLFLFLLHYVSVGGRKLGLCQTSSALQIASFVRLILHRCQRMTTAFNSGTDKLSVRGA